MSVSKTKLRDPKISRWVVATFLAEDKPTLKETAERTGVHENTVRAILKRDVDPERLRQEKSLRYSRSKTGLRNPMRNKRGKDHHNHVERSLNKEGYVTVPRPDWYQANETQNRVKEHRVVACQMLGLNRLPEGTHVHHIDEDRTNNDPSNLAIVTGRGHRRLHARSPLRRFTLWELYRSGTSR